MVSHASRSLTKKKHISKEVITQYTHEDEKRANNPPIGLVTAETDKLNGKRKYEFDLHIDPQLQWAGKKEGTSFEIDTISLHVHERIDPLTIIETVKRKGQGEQKSLFHYFENLENNPPIREAIEFYKHSQGWSNRLIAGDSLLVMNSLLEKEGMAGKVQMIYIDPPYGIKYGSNFQPFVNNRDVKDGKDEDLTQEPETIKAFRDTWELGIHSYLTYLRNRLLLARQLLHESGSCFVQISDENIHRVRLLMDEIFGSSNFVSLVTVKKTGGMGQKNLDNVSDYIIWYCRDKNHTKYRQLYLLKSFDDYSTSLYNYGKFGDGTSRKLTDEQFELAIQGKIKCRLFRPTALVSQSGGENSAFGVKFEGKIYYPQKGYWKTNEEGFEKLKKANRLMIVGNRLNYIRFLDDFSATSLTNLWDRLGGAANKIYVVQTNPTIMERCILMTTDPGDLVLDPTCGSGTAAYIAEQWGRRWITCDTSRVSIILAKQRLMTSIFDYYELAYPKEGVSSGFNYKTIPHTTLKSITNSEPPQQEILYDQPIIDRSKKRVTGPFTLEAVPSQIVRSFEDVETKQEADLTIARSGETVKQNDWMDKLLAAGIRGKGGQVMQFVRIESLPATRWIHAEAETRDGQKVVISFGPEFAPLEQRQVELAIEEAQSLVPKPKIVIFASFQFDPEAAKDIDELKWGGVTVLKAQMDTDILTEDLKKKPKDSPAFWLVGQPDIEVNKKGDKYVVTVNGFDYYNTKIGEIESGDVSKIAMWELDTDYDGRSLYPRQVFFPMARTDEGWNKLAKNLKAQIDENLIEKYIGNTSLPFSLGKNKQIAIKIIDDRGIESLKIIKVRE